MISSPVASELRPVGAFSQLPITNYQLPIPQKYRNRSGGAPQAHHPQEEFEHQYV